jgi:eukaryotic-like serine/threonine-protein kinase
VAEALEDRASALLWQDDLLPQAEQAARLSVEIYSILPKLHPDRAEAEAVLGEVLRLRGKFAEASAVIEEVLNAYRQVYGADHRRIAYALDSLARIAWAQHRLADAEALELQAIESHIKAGRSKTFVTGMTRTMLAVIQTERGKYAEAEVQLRAAMTVFDETQAVDDPNRAATEYFLGVTLLATHRPREAEQYFRAAMERAKRAGEPEWRVARAASGFGEALYAQGRAREAEAYLADGYRIVSSSEFADDRSKEVVRERVARFYIERGQPDKLQALVNGPLRVAAER